MVSTNWYARYTRKVLCSTIGTSSVCTPLVEFLYLVFTRMPGESYRRRPRTLLPSCGVFRVPINSLVCGAYARALGLCLLETVADSVVYLSVYPNVYCI